MSDTVNLIIGGDLFPMPINFDLFSKGKAADIFGDEICKLFADSDFAICNLEGCFTDETTPPKPKGGPNIRAPKSSVKAITDLGVDCVTLANNHVTDYGLTGLKDTCSVLDQEGIDHFGAGENEASVTTHHTVTIKGKRITFYNVAETIENVPTETSPGVNIYDEYRVCNEIQSLKSKCDFLIVLYHGGIQSTHYNTPSIRKRFHRMADNGADIIISQHTHAIGEEEYYNGAYFLYGQGNFCFHYSKTIRETAATAILLEIVLDDNGFNIKKHLVRREGPRVRYDKDQDFTAFYERSKRLTDGDDFNKELRELADEKIRIYLQAFRGRNILDKIVKKICSKEKYTAYLRKQYSQYQILTILLAIQCEEFGEVSAQGLINMLAELEKKKG